MKTKGGRALLAVRENPRVAATFGADVKVYTLMAFVVAGVFAGLGGALLAHNDTFVVRDLFNFQLALVFVIMTVIGGLRNRTGVVIGSAFFALASYFFEKLFKHGLSIPGVKTLPKEYVPIVIGPLVFGSLPVVNPNPARLQPSPFRSLKLPVAPAEVGSAFRIS